MKLAHDNARIHMSQIMETEIICISSDESDSQKENKKKSSSVNSTEVVNNALHAKVEASSNNGEKVEESNLKRKISQISEKKRSPLYHNVEKRKKINTSQNTPELEKNSNTISNCVQKLNKEQTTIAEMPKLIVKERKVVSYVAHDIFPQFISLCLKKCHDNDMEKIVDKLKRRYEELESDYSSSAKFALFLNEKHEAIMSNDKKLYVHIEEVMNEMKRMIKEKLKNKLTNNIVYDAVPSTSYATDKVSAHQVAELDDVEHVDSETRRKIKTIERAMRKCEYRIKKFESAEVDFDEEADSNYIKMERYKQRMVELYNKLCELTGENTDAGRSHLRPKHISTTQIVAVDQAITNFINSKISKRNNSKKLGSLTNNLIFPDYTDILECVSRCNEKRNLGLMKSKQIEMAKKAFTELGEYLQRSRQNDYWDTFSLYLESAEEDPAIKDKELANKLSCNRSEGQKRLTAVFEKYEKKQEEIKKQIYNGTTMEDESDMDDDDKDEDEDEDEDMDKDDILSLHSSSNEDNDSVKDVNEINKNNLSSAQRNNNTTINANRDTNASNKTEKNVSQEKYDKEAEVKTPTKENCVPISKGENKTATNAEKVSILPVSNVIVTVKNITGINANMQANSVSTSTAKCADTTNRTEEHVAEVIEGVQKVVTESPAEVIIKERTMVLVKDAAIREDIAEVITEDVEEMMTETTELIMKDDVTDPLSIDVSEDKLADEAKKPLLRVRSFARPPTTWDDGRQKTNKTQENTPKTTSQNKDLIDLTDDSNVNESVPAISTTSTAPAVSKCSIQLDGKVVPLMKKHQTLVLPSRNNIISVQNITNNYLKVNMRTGEIIAPARNVQAPTIIHMPSMQTATIRQSQVQSANASTTSNKIPIKRNKTIWKIFPKKTFVVKNSDPKVMSKTQLRVISPKPK